MILDFAFVFGFYLNFCSEKRQTVLQAKSFYICLFIVLIYRASRADYHARGISEVDDANRRGAASRGTYGHTNELAN